MYVFMTKKVFWTLVWMLEKRKDCKRNCFTVKNEPNEEREFHFKWISKYKGCGILSFAFKEWMVTFEKRLETSSKKLKIKITKKDET
jgi:transposase-like protein